MRPLGDILDTCSAVNISCRADKQSDQILTNFVTSMLRAFPVSPLLPVSWIALNQLFHALGEFFDRSL